MGETRIRLSRRRGFLLFSVLHPTPPFFTGSFSGFQSDRKFGKEEKFSPEENREATEHVFPLDRRVWQWASSPFS